MFALVNLPETVKGALFARYSRSAKSLRRLFLDEFLDREASEPFASTAGAARAERLYERVFNEYGDDSVAQLGGVHLAVENASNILTKILERGRLMAYLEQSTRYVPYTTRVDDRWRYLVPAELDGHPLRQTFVDAMDDAFDTYARWIDPLREWLSRRYPKAAADSDAVHRSAIRAKALDTLRGLLPAATQSNVGIYGTGQAYESMLLRMRASPLREARDSAAAILAELRQVIPAFLTRVDEPDRGGRWTRYFEETASAVVACADRLVPDRDEPETETPEVTLTDFDPDGEIKTIAACLYETTDWSDEALLSRVRAMSSSDREAVLRAYVGDRGNRRHKPGRAFERTTYRFDVVTDYGAFRDLQRHRLLSIVWQPLSVRHGSATPETIHEAGVTSDWQRVMDRSREVHDALVSSGLERVAPYAVAMAYRVRFVMEMNAREAMHVIELRTSPQGHPAYRRVCQAMHRLIEERAGHRLIAAAMRFADHSDVDLERLQAERRLEARRQSS